MLISSGVSNKCLLVPAPYYKLNKGYFSSAFCLNRSVGIGYFSSAFCLNRSVGVAEEKYPLFTTY